MAKMAESLMAAQKLSMAAAKRRKTAALTAAKKAGISAIACRRRCVDSYGILV